MKWHKKIMRATVYKTIGAFFAGNPKGHSTSNRSVYYEADNSDYLFSYGTHYLLAKKHRHYRRQLNPFSPWAALTLVNTTEHSVTTTKMSSACLLHDGSVGVADPNNPDFSRTKMYEEVSVLFDKLSRRRTNQRWAIAGISHVVSNIARLEDFFNLEPSPIEIPGKLTRKLIQWRLEGNNASNTWPQLLEKINERRKDKYGRVQAA